MLELKGTVRRPWARGEERELEVVVVRGLGVGGWGG